MSSNLTLPFFLCEFEKVSLPLDVIVRLKAKSNDLLPRSPMSNFICMAILTSMLHEKTFSRFNLTQISQLEDTLISWDELLRIWAESQTVTTDAGPIEKHKGAYYTTYLSESWGAVASTPVGHDVTH